MNWIKANVHPPKDGMYLVWINGLVNEYPMVLRWSTNLKDLDDFVFESDCGWFDEDFVDDMFEYVDYTNSVVYWAEVTEPEPED